jgi:hypothetical protein
MGENMVFLDNKIILPEDFAEFDLEIEKLFYGED